MLILPFLEFQLKRILFLSLRNNSFLLTDAPFSLTYSMRPKRHNPEKVNSCFIPKGYRLLNVNEIGTHAVRFNCRAWYDNEYGFSPNSDYLGQSESITYITKK
jgi:hypothetical protein